MWGPWIRVFCFKKRMVLGCETPMNTTYSYHVYIMFHRVFRSVSSFSSQKILSGGWMSAEGAEIVDVDPDNPSSLE